MLFIKLNSFCAKKIAYIINKTIQCTEGQTIEQM